MQLPFPDEDPAAYPPPQGPPMMGGMGAPMPGMPGMGGDPNGNAGMNGPDEAALMQTLPEKWRPENLVKRIDLRVRLNEEQQRKLGVRLAAEAKYFDNSTQQRRQNMADWRDDATMMPDYPMTDGRDADPSPSWMSRSRSVLTSVACRSATQKLIQQILLPHPMNVAVPMQKMWESGGKQFDLVTEAPNVEEAWDSLLDEAKWPQVARELFEELPVCCPCAVKVVWEKDVIYVPEQTVDQDDEAFQAYLEGGVEPGEAWLESFDTDSRGNPKVKPVWKEKVLREGNTFSVIRAEELVYLPVNVRHPKDAYAIGERIRISGQELMDKKRETLSGYFPDAIDKVLKEESDSFNETQQLRLERRALTPSGASEDEEDYPEHRQYDCLKLAYKGRLGSEKFDKWYWLLVHVPSQTLLQACVILDRHGLCPYTIFGYYGTGFDAMGVAELNAVPQDQFSKSMNDALDLQTILVNQGGSVWVGPGAGLDPNTFTWTPGRAQPCLNPEQIKPVEAGQQNIPPALAALGASLEMQKNLSQLLTSTSNVSLGKEADGDATATEVRAVFSADQAISEVLGLGVAMSEAELLEKFRQNVSQYAKGSTQAYIAKDPAGQVLHKKIDVELLSAPYKIEPAGLTASSSGEARYAKANIAYQLVLSNPVFLEDPMVVLEAALGVFQSLGTPNGDKWVAQAQARIQEQMMMQKMQMLAEGQVAEEENAEMDAQNQQGAADEEAGAAAHAEMLAKAATQKLPGPPGKNGKPGPGMPPPMMDIIGAMSGANGGGIRK